MMLCFYKARVFQALTGNPDSDRRRRRRRRRKGGNPEYAFSASGGRTLAPSYAAVYSTLFFPSLRRKICNLGSKETLWAAAGGRKGMQLKDTPFFGGGGAFLSFPVFFTFFPLFFCGMEQLLISLSFSPIDQIANSLSSTSSSSSSCPPAARTKDFHFPPETEMIRISPEKKRENESSLGFSFSSRPFPGFSPPPRIVQSYTYIRRPNPEKNFFSFLFFFPVTHHPFFKFRGLKYGEGKRVAPPEMKEKVAC